MPNEDNYTFRDMFCIACLSIVHEFKHGSITNMMLRTGAYNLRLDLELTRAEREGGTTNMYRVGYTLAFIRSCPDEG